MGRPPTNPQTRLKRAREELSDVFAGLDEKRRKTVDKLLDNAAFMSVQLEDLRAVIQENWNCQENRTPRKHIKRPESYVPESTFHA